MPKKRKSETAGLEDVEKTLFSSFCAAANSLSHLYSLAQTQQRAGFQAGERQALIRVQQWAAAEGSMHRGGGNGASAQVLREKLLDFIQGELDRVEEGPVLQQQWQGGMAGTGLGGGVHGQGQGQAPELQRTAQGVTLDSTPPRAGHPLGASGTPTSHLLSQLHHCHIRPHARAAPDGGCSSAATPTQSDSSCWDSPSRSPVHPRASEGNAPLPLTTTPPSGLHARPSPEAPQPTHSMGHTTGPTAGVGSSSNATVTGEQEARPLVEAQAQAQAQTQARTQAQAQAEAQALPHERRGFSEMEPPRGHSGARGPASKVARLEGPGALTRVSGAMLPGDGMSAHGQHQGQAQASAGYFPGYGNLPGSASHFGECDTHMR